MIKAAEPLSDPIFSRKSKQCGRGAAEYGFTFDIGQVRRQDVFDGIGYPGVRIVRAHDDLAGAHLRGEVPQRLRSKYDRVIVQALQVLGRSLAGNARLALLWKNPAALVGPIHIRRKIPSTMCRANLQAWKSIQRP